MRGLKQVNGMLLVVEVASHLLQMRGLKQKVDSLPEPGEVASFTDAWIETKTTKRRYIRRQSHLLQMRGLKLFTTTVLACRNSRIFYRCVD